MTLPHINSFDTDNPAKLSRQLSDLEDNVSAELDRVRGESVPVLLVSKFTASPSRAIVAISADQQLSVDSSVANAAVVFPPLDPKNFGRRFVLIKCTLNGQVTTSCQDPAVLCNATTFPLLAAAAVGVFVFCCDSTGYYFR